ncbi:HAD family hydrolase [Bacillaceae bacterium JMAK1]|nr:HAD family hydrolase [Bacillaceae bacterium JMAK1]
MQRGYIFDLDGTIYLGNKEIPGAAKTIRTLRERGDRVLFMSNNPLFTRLEFKRKLAVLSIDVKVDEIYNSNYILARHLKNCLTSKDRVFVIGEAPLYEELQNANIPLTFQATEATIVVVSWDRDFTYKKLKQAYVAYQNGATFIATNPDRTCPIEGGAIPDCGAIIGAIEGATGEEITEIAGKPSSITTSVIQDAVGLPATSCYMVGDRLETDIKMANDANWHSVLVLTGVTTTDILEKSLIVPQTTLTSVRELLNV